MLIGLAAAATFAAGLAAVAQHANATSAGYELAVAQREHVELARIAARAEQRLSRLSTPQAAMARAQAPAMKQLASLKWPKSWNVVRAATLEACAAAPAAAFEPARTAAPGPRGGAR